MYSIYMYKNIVNNKVYIGQTKTTLEQRAQRNGLNYKECRKFFNAIEKYGWDSFAPQVIATTDSLSEANMLEEFYISLYNSTDDKCGYNIHKGGNNRAMSEETKKIISKKAKDRYANPANNPMYGKHHSDETKLLQSEKKTGSNNPMYGRKWTQTQRDSCGTSGKHLQLTDTQRQILSERGKENGKKNAKRIYCIEDDKYFNSATDAAKFYCVDVSTLCGSANGKQKTCKGKHFKYTD